MLTLSIPGPWAAPNELQNALDAVEKNRYLIAGNISLIDLARQDLVLLEASDHQTLLKKNCYYGGGGAMTKATLRKIARHQAVINFHFSRSAVAERERIVHFSEIFQKAGGFAIQVKDSGIAHEWEHWFSLMRSGTLRDTYAAMVVHVYTDSHSYSCGMHCFDLPDAQLPHLATKVETHRLLNCFNGYQLTSDKKLETGHTVRFGEDDPFYRIALLQEEHFPKEYTYYNPHGVWNLTPLDQAESSPLLPLD